MVPWVSTLITRGMSRWFGPAPVSERAEAYPATGLPSSLRPSSCGRLPSRQRGVTSHGRKAGVQLWAVGTQRPQGVVGRLTYEGMGVIVECGSCCG